MTAKRGDVHIHGLRKHAGGAGDGINTHATGGDDALTAADIGAGIQPVYRAFRQSFNVGQNQTADTREAAFTPSTNRVFQVLTLKLRANRGQSGANISDAVAHFRLKYTDGTQADSPAFSSGATPAVQIPVWHDRSGNTAGSTQGATENLDATTDFVATFTPDGKVVASIEFWAKNSVVAGTGATATIDCFAACLET